jgi:hypothetical protein
MNRNKLSELILCILLIFGIFSFIPVVLADPPEEWGSKPWPWQRGGPAYLWKKPAGNWIGAWPWLGPGGYWEIPQDEYSWFRIGWQVSDFEIEAGWDPGPPYKYRLFVDGEEIPMQRWCRTFKDQIVMFPDGVIRTVDSRAWMFIATFDPGFFELGEHEIRVQFLVKKPYIGSDSNKWRFYTNYQSGPGFEAWYGPVGLVNDQFHTLNVV